MLTPNDPEHEFNLKLVVSKEGGIKTEGTAVYLLEIRQWLAGVQLVL